MLDETPSSGRCDVRLLPGGLSGPPVSPFVYLYCRTHHAHIGGADTPEEAWARQQEHARRVADGGTQVVGTLVEPDASRG